MYFSNTLERPDVFLDKGIELKVSLNPSLNVTHFQTTGPWGEQWGEIHYTSSPFSFSSKQAQSTQVQCLHKASSTLAVSPNAEHHRPHKLLLSLYEHGGLALPLAGLDQGFVLLFSPRHLHLLYHSRILQLVRSIWKKN